MKHSAESPFHFSIPYSNMSSMLEYGRVSGSSLRNRKRWNGDTPFWFHKLSVNPFLYGLTDAFLGINISRERLKPEKLNKLNEKRWPHLNTSSRPSYNVNWKTDTLHVPFLKGTCKGNWPPPYATLTPFEDLSSGGRKVRHTRTPRIPRIRWCVDHLPMLIGKQTHYMFHSRKEHVRVMGPHINMLMWGPKTCSTTKARSPKY